MTILFLALSFAVRTLFTGINFTVNVIPEPDSFNDHYCFILELEWDPIITANHTLTQLNTSNIYAINWNYVIYYQSITNSSGGNITFGDNPLSTNITLSQFSENVLMTGLNYSFWLQADLYLSNGTHLIVETQGYLANLPQCPSAAGKKNLECLLNCILPL